MRPRNVLFITWDGPQTNYLESLFLPIFLRLSKRSWKFHVLQFSWESRDITRVRTQKLQKQGIYYRHVPVVRHLKLLGAPITALYGAFACFRLIRLWGIDLLMPRSVLPGLVALLVVRFSKIPVVYDSDGLAADEKVDNQNLSPGSLTYRFLRQLEATVVSRSVVTLTRTKFASEHLRGQLLYYHLPSPEFIVVSNGKDVSGSDSDTSARTYSSARPGQGFRLCYVGSWGPQYLPEVMFAFAEKLKAEIPRLSFSIFTQNPETVCSDLPRFILGDSSWITVKYVEPKDLRDQISACDLGLAFRKRTLSSLAVQPIKIGDYLLAGIPVIGVPSGDSGAELVERGVFFPLLEKSVSEGLEWVQKAVIMQRKSTRISAKIAGKELFGIDRSVNEYLEALRITTRITGH